MDLVEEQFYGGPLDGRRSAGRPGQRLHILCGPYGQWSAHRVTDHLITDGRMAIYDWADDLNGWAFAGWEDDRGA